MWDFEDIFLVVWIIIIIIALIFGAYKWKTDDSNKKKAVQKFASAENQRTRVPIDPSEELGQQLMAEYRKKHSSVL